MLSATASPTSATTNGKDSSRAGSVRTNTVLVTVNASVTPTASHATTGSRSWLLKATMPVIQANANHRATTSALRIVSAVGYSAGRGIRVAERSTVTVSHPIVLRHGLAAAWRTCVRVGVVGCPM